MQIIRIIAKRSLLWRGESVKNICTATITLVYSRSDARPVHRCYFFFLCPKLSINRQRCHAITVLLSRSVGSYTCIHLLVVKVFFFKFYIFLLEFEVCAYAWIEAEFSFWRRSYGLYCTCCGNECANMFVSTAL